jgi:hypothetical protein
MLVFDSRVFVESTLSIKNLKQPKRHSTSSSTVAEMSQGCLPLCSMVKRGIFPRYLTYYLSESPRFKLTTVDCTTLCSRSKTRTPSTRPGPRQSGTLKWREASQERIRFAKGHFPRLPPKCASVKAS